MTAQPVDAYPSGFADELLASLDRLCRYAADDLPLQICEQLAGSEVGERLDGMGRTLAALRASRTRLQEAERTMEDAMAEVMRTEGFKRRHVDGIGTLEHRRGTIRKQWEHDALCRKAVTVAMERGEVEHPHDVAELILRLAGFSYWRVGALKPFGLDPDEYCHTEPGRDTVVITPDADQ